MMQQDELIIETSDLKQKQKICHELKLLNRALNSYIVANPVEKPTVMCPNNVATQTIDARKSIINTSIPKSGK